MSKIWNHQCEKADCLDKKTLSFDKIIYHKGFDGPKTQKMSKQFWLCKAHLLEKLNNIKNKMGLMSIKPQYLPPTEELNHQNVQTLLAPLVDQKKNVAKAIAFPILGSSHSKFVEAMKKEPKPSHTKVREAALDARQRSRMKEIMLDIRSISKNEINYRQLVDTYNESPELILEHIARSKKKKKKIRRMTALTGHRSRYSIVIKDDGNENSMGRFFNNYLRIENIHHTTVGKNKYHIPIKYILPKYKTFLSLLEEFKIEIKEQDLTMLARKYKKFFRNELSFKVIDGPFEKEYKENYDLLKAISIPNGDKEIKLFDYQAEDISKFLIKDNSMCTFQVGVGKTLTGLVWSIYKSEGKTLIVTPARNKLDPWMNTLSKNFGDRKSLLVDSKKVRQKILTEDYEFLVIPYSLIIDPVVQQYLKKVGIKKLIADESHSLKSHVTSAYKAMRNISHKIPYKMLMTATPVTKDLRDYFTQIQLIWKDSAHFIDTVEEYEIGMNNGYMHTHTKTSWNRAYQSEAGVFSPDKGGSIPYFKNLVKLLDKLQITRSTEDAKQAMAKTYGTKLIEVPLIMKRISVPITDKELRFYKDTAKDQKRELLYRYRKYENPERMAAGQMTRIFSVLCSCPNSFKEDDSATEPHSKLLKSLEIAKELVAQGKKVLVVTRHREAFNELREAMQFEFGYNLFVRGSDLSTKKREQVGLDFRNHKSGGVMLGTIGTLASGLNLEFVTDVIVAAIPFTHTELIQTVGRCLRSTTMHTVVAHILVLNKTFDVNLFNYVASKSKNTVIATQGKIISDKEAIVGMGGSDAFSDEFITYDEF